MTTADGFAVRGVMVRHQVLPHNLAGTDRSAEFIAAPMGPSGYVNIMPQYRPRTRRVFFPELAIALR